MECWGLYDSLLNGINLYQASDVTPKSHFSLCFLGPVLAPLASLRKELLPETLTWTLCAIGLMGEFSRGHYL